MIVPAQERFKDPYFYIHMVGMPFNLMIGIMTLIGGGIMERYPRIKFVFLEIGAAWLPYWMWRMDDHYSRSMHHPPAYRKSPATMSGATAVSFHANRMRMVSRIPLKSLELSALSLHLTIRTATVTFRIQLQNSASGRHFRRN